MVIYQRVRFKSRRSSFTVIFMCSYEPLDLQTVETSELSNVRKVVQHPSAQISRWSVLFYWLSWTEQPSAVRCFHSRAQNKTRWQLQYCPLSDSDTFLSLQLWRETIDGLVSQSMRLRSLLGLPENNTYADTVPEETGKW